MTELKKGHNFAIQGLTEKKNKCSLFFVLMLYIKFQVPSSSCSLVLQPIKGVTDRRTDGQTFDWVMPLFRLYQYRWTGPNQ